MLSFNTRVYRIAPKFHDTKISSNVPNCSIIDFREVVADGTHENATHTNIHEKIFREYWVNHENILPQNLEVYDMCKCLCY